MIPAPQHGSRVIPGRLLGIVSTRKRHVSQLQEGRYARRIATETWSWSPAVLAVAAGCVSSGREYSASSALSALGPPEGCRPVWSGFFSCANVFCLLVSAVSLVYLHIDWGAGLYLARLFLFVRLGAPAGHLKYRPVWSVYPQTA